MVHRIITATLALFLTLCGTLSAQVYNQFSPGGDLTGAGSTWNAQYLGAGTVTLAKQTNLAADSIQCNATSSSATPQACNPLAAANLMSAVLAVDAASASGNITLSGTQTVDGVALSQGQSVLVGAQTSNTTNGIYIVRSGAWTLAINFPSGYVIAQNCDLVVHVKAGTLFRNANFHLNTSGGSITIGTSAQSWTLETQVGATVTSAGAVTVTNAAVAQVPSFGTVPAASFDCADFNGVGSPSSLNPVTIGDDGNAAGTTGGCIVGDTGGHPILNGSGTGPMVSGTGCTLTAGGRDNTGSIVAVGVDTCTLTFGAAFTTTPNCSATGVGATVIPYLNALPTTSAAVFKTTAAGTFTYTCL